MALIKPYIFWIVTVLLLIGEIVWMSMNPPAVADDRAPGKTPPGRSL